MEYKIFKFTFKSGVHIGDGSLDGTGINLRADTLFSALCIEALKSGGPDLLNSLVLSARSGEMLLSDAFPFIGDEYYLPKPVYGFLSERGKTDSQTKKAFKNLKYISIDTVDDYLNGEFDKNTAVYISDKLSKLGAQNIMARVAVRSPEGVGEDANGDPLPYHVGIYRFAANAGLYVIAGGGRESFALLKKLLSHLANSGIGGKRSSGLGRFTVSEAALPDGIQERFEEPHPAYMTLSVSLPTDAEIQKTLEEASYTLLRRSGFVFSENYAETPLRKNDLFVLGSGCVVRHKYGGDIYDVSNKGAHPVYRYAKGLFYGVTV